MRARLMDQETILGEMEIGKKPPRHKLNGADCFSHCGTLVPENIAIYRVKPFGGGQAMPLKRPRNQHVHTNLLPYKGREW